MTKTTSSKPGRHCQGPLVDQGTVRGALRNGSSASRRRHRTGRAAREPSRRRTQPPAAASGLPAEGHTGGERGSLPPSERRRRRRQGERPSGNTRAWKPHWIKSARRAGSGRRSRGQWAVSLNTPQGTQCRKKNYVLLKSGIHPSFPSHVLSSNIWKKKNLPYK